MTLVNSLCAEISIYQGVGEPTGFVVERSAIRGKKGLCKSMRDLAIKSRVLGDGYYYIPIDLWPEDEGAGRRAQARLDRHRLDPAHAALDQEAGEAERASRWLATAPVSGSHESLPVGMARAVERPDITMGVFSMKSCVALLFTAFLTLPVLAQNEEGPATAKGAAVDTTGKGYTAAYVIEPTTHRVLFEENAHVPLPTASMAKMMTALITMEEIRDGRLKLDTPVTISARPARWAARRSSRRKGRLSPCRRSWPH